MCNKFIDYLLGSLLGILIGHILGKLLEKNKKLRKWKRRTIYPIFKKVVIFLKHLINFIFIWIRKHPRIAKVIINILRLLDKFNRKVYMCFWFYTEMLWIIHHKIQNKSNKRRKNEKF